MTLCSTYDVPLAYGGNTVSLRPSLRAATQLAKYQGGFPALIAKLQERDTATIKAVIQSGATDKQEATAFLSGLSDKPLRTIDNTFLAPLYRLIMALMSPSRDPAPAPDHAASAPMDWADLYTDLFKIATGWLGWTPTEAWNATLLEITDAFDGHTTKLKAMHGGDETDTATGTDAAQRQANIDAGLDPDFDRQGLQALRGMGSANG